jgi:hypothetical protein
VRSSPGALQSSEWDGTWIGSWGSDIAAKIIISEGKVLECDYRGNLEKDLGQTVVSGNTLTFGTPPGSVITLTKPARLLLPRIIMAHLARSMGSWCGNSSWSNLDTTCVFEDSTNECETTRALIGRRFGCTVIKTHFTIPT